MGKKFIKTALKRVTAQQTTGIDASVKPKKGGKKAAKPVKRPRARDAWFWVSALYRSDQGKKKNTAEQKLLWERRVFVFKVALGQERKEARAIAKKHEHKYKNVNGETVHWKLQDVEGYAELFASRIVSGTEVYWTFLEQ
jgi:hypothetical protein